MNTATETPFLRAPKRDVPYGGVVILVMGSRLMNMHEVDVY